jgi:hypothetical protein
MKTISSGAISDLCALADILKTLASDNLLVEVLAGIKEQKEEVAAKFSELAVKEEAVKKLELELNEIKLSIASDKEQSAKMLESSKETLASAKEKEKSFSDLANGLAEAKEKFYAEVSEKESSLLAREAEAKSALEEALAIKEKDLVMKFEYEEKVSKLKDVVG